jgi:hypothetical protein
MVITDSGVGIGTATPNRKLTVQDSVGTVAHFDSTNASGSGGGISLADANTTSNYVRIRAVGDDLQFTSGNAERMRIDASGNAFMKTANSYIAGTTSLGFYGDAASSNGMFINSSGRVGIGTTSPDENLQVFQTATAGNNYNQGRIKVGGTTSVLGFQMAYTAQSSGRASLTSLNPSGTSNNRIYIGFGALDSSGEPDTSVMTLNQSGRVGINTNSPEGSYKLDVRGWGTFTHPTGDCNLKIQTGNNTGFSVLQFGDTDDTDAGYVAYNHASNYMSFRTNGSGEDMRIDSSGRVGIGTNSPNANAKLTLSGSGLEVPTGYGVFNDSGGANATGINFTAGANILSFYTGNSERMRISADGEVTKPYQPSFMVSKSSDQTLVVGTGANTITWQNEVWNVGGNFDIAANEFAAPVTGKYYLQTQLRIDNFDTASAHYLLKIITSNRTKQVIVDPNFSSDLSYYTMNLSSVFDMDAGDIAYVALTQYSGTASHIDDSSSYTSFSGYLLG